MTSRKKYDIIFSAKYNSEGGVFLESKSNGNTAFEVPCVVADNFLRLATGEQIKVLLYLLRCSGRECPAEEIAVNTGVSIQEAEDAVLFWQQVNIFPSQQSAGQTVSGNNIKETAPESEKADFRKKPFLRPSEIEEITKESSELHELFATIESMLGMFNNAWQNTVIWLYTYLGLKKEVIVTLVGYCKEVGKTHPNYIEKMAVSWAEDDINTMELAQEEVQRKLAEHEFRDEVMRNFEMKRLSKSQKAMIAEWKKMGISHELINLAYDKTISTINDLSFPYINSILVSWHEQGIKTSSEVFDNDSEHKKKKTQKSGSYDDFDVEMYEKICINNFEVI